MSASLLPDLLKVAQEVGRSGCKILVVCPTPEGASEGRKILSGVIPGDALFSGRTALFPGGGQVTLIQADEDFAPDESTAVLFLGWEGVSEAVIRKMASWRKSAAKVLIRL